MTQSSSACESEYPATGDAGMAVNILNRPSRMAVEELRCELVDRAALVAPALRNMAADLAAVRRELSCVRRENAALKRSLRESTVRSYLSHRTPA